MMRFVNPQKASYHYSLINEFSEIDRFIASGSTKGFVRSRYAWFADFANKFTGNDTFNTHTAYVSFFSDYEIFVSEYANVEQITDQYPFLLTVADSILSDHDHEMSTKQYFRIANQRSAFDVIEFVNESKLLIYDYNQSFTEDGIFHHHDFYYAPVIYETGYRIDKGELTIDTQAGFYLYAWASRYSSQINIKDYSFRIHPAEFGTDISGTIAGYITDAGTSNVKRLIDYKVIPTEIKWDYFESPEVTVHYPYDFKDGEPWTYRPYLGFPMLYQKVNDTEFSEFGHLGYSSIYPQISLNHVIERQKIQFNRTFDYGRGYFYSSGLSYERDDQSMIVFDVSRYCVYDSGSYNYRFGQKMDWGLFSSGITIPGIDIDTQRNRRYSAIVMTEPYMTVRPIHNGQIIEYKFVTDSGGELSTFPSQKDLCMKIKAPRSFHRSLARKLNEREYNTDIMHVVSWAETDPFSAISTTLAGEYGQFKGATYLQRQDFCVDDLINGIFGIGNHMVMKMDLSGYGVDSTKYTDGYAKVVGMGFYVKTEKVGTFERRLKLYCCNYTPPEVDNPGDLGPQPNDSNIVTTTASDVLVEENELFRPMIKLPGLGGYIKIIRRSPRFKPTILNDGNEETIYEIEVPYCCGSYQTRLASNGVGYRKSQVVYADSYINAGSHELDSNGMLNDYNARYAPADDAAFSRTDLLHTRGYYGDIESDPESLGGKTGTLATSRPQNRLVYPEHLVYWPYRRYGSDIFMLSKPNSSVDGLQNYGKSGTFEIRENEGSTPLRGDYKVVWCVDNRTWRYDEDKFSSYINRECPAYVFEIDANGLIDEFGREQYKYAGIPDIKRWIYARAMVFCSTLTTSFVENDDESHTDGSLDVATQDSKSDVSIEVWDSAYPIGSTTRAMWRPLTATVYDDDKASSKVLVEGMHAEGSKILQYGNLYKVTLAKIESSFALGLSTEDVLAVANQSNFVLIDTGGFENKSYHVAYVTEDSTDPDNVKLSVYLVMDASDTLTDGSGFFTDPYNWVGPISISKPYANLSKKTDFSFNSSKVVSSETMTRYMDFGDKNSSDSDFNRYVDSNGKIYVRIRPLKARTYPVAYNPTFGSPDVMQWIGDRVESAFAQTNFPWYDIVDGYDEKFDWSKIDLIERIGKLGLNYFALQSK